MEITSHFEVNYGTYHITVTVILEDVHANIPSALSQVDCSIPRLSDSVLLIGAALRLCQQLKDKVSNFKTLCINHF